MAEPVLKTPRDVEGYLRSAILNTFGDKVENQSDVIASRGYYSVYIKTPTQTFTFGNFRKSEAGKIAKAIRALG